MSSVFEVGLDDARQTGDALYRTVERLYPICRSITGNGVRETLAILSEHVPFMIHEVPSGTAVFDWTVPDEWNIHGAWIKTPDGRTIVDFKQSNLHVVNYSVPVRGRFSLTELKKHLHSLPDQPSLIPYRTSYYAPTWGFCVPHELLQSLPDTDYDVSIDSTLRPGSLTYAEYLHRGDSDDEVLLSAHVCHPSLANDNCSGLAILAAIAQRLKGVRTRYSYRFLCAPGTIGAITWLARNREFVHHVRHGLTLSCLGDESGPYFKRSRRGDAMIDRAAAHVIGHDFLSATIVPFSPYGYDERQFCSPGFNLPVGLLQRSQHGTFPQYHTSADNLAFVTSEALATSLRTVLRILDVLERNRTLCNRSPYCEPQLGRRGLYQSLGGAAAAAEKNMAMLWVLNLSDGQHSLLDIAQRANMAFTTIAGVAETLEAAGLLGASTERQGEL